MKSPDKEQIQHDIRQRRDAKEQQRHHGIAHRPQQIGHEIIQKHRHDPGKDPYQILPHQRSHFRRNPQEYQNTSHSKIHRRVQHKRHQPDGQKRNVDPLFQPVLIPAAKLYGEKGAAAHAQSDDDRCQEHHQRIGRPYRRQRILSQIPPHDQRIHHIIQLLQQIPHHDGECKPKQLMYDFSFCQITVHDS